MLPNDDEPVRLEQDIKPLFCPRYEQSTKSHFDLWATPRLARDNDAVLTSGYVIG